jgi:hypothetical protein
MISNYPNLQSVLIDVIPQYVYSDLQRFNICALPHNEREDLINAYKDDVDEDVLRDFLIEKVSYEDISTAYGNRDSVNTVLDMAIHEAIYDLAQDMGSILEEIERNNNTADRINE